MVRLAVVQLTDKDMRVALAVLAVHTEMAVVVARVAWVARVV
jgi:hypothetical protein